MVVENRFLRTSAAVRRTEDNRSYAGQSTLPKGRCPIRHKRVLTRLLATLNEVFRNPKLINSKPHMSQFNNKRNKNAMLTYNELFLSLQLQIYFLHISRFSGLSSGRNN
jgi:hypothetical protein